MLPLSARLATVLVAGSLVAPSPAAAQHQSMKAAFIQCLYDEAQADMILPEKCMDIISWRHDRWENKDVNEYGVASSLADWKDASPRGGPCDSLMDFMHKTLPVAVNPRDDEPNTVFLYWADFKDGWETDGTTFELFSEATPLGVYHVVLRRNYDDRKWGWSSDRVKEHKYHVLAHELRHVMRKDMAHETTGDTTAVDTDGCTERNVFDEERVEDPTTVSWWPEDTSPNCTITTHWKCETIVIPVVENAEEVEEETGVTLGPVCALIEILNDTYYVCAGDDLRVCHPDIKVYCDETGGGGNIGGGELNRAACAVPDADALRPRSGIRAAE